MLHTQQHIHVYNRQKNEAIVVRKSATKNDFAVKTKFFYFFLTFALYAGRSCTYKVKHYDSYQQCCQLIYFHKIVLKLAPLNTKCYFQKRRNWIRIWVLLFHVFPFQLLLRTIISIPCKNSLLQSSSLFNLLCYWYTQCGNYGISL